MKFGIKNVLKRTRLLSSVFNILILTSISSIFCRSPFLNVNYVSILIKHLIRYQYFSFEREQQNMRENISPRILISDPGYRDLNQVIPKSQTENSAQDSIPQISVNKSNKRVLAWEHPSMNFGIQNCSQKNTFIIFSFQYFDLDFCLLIS